MNQENEHIAWTAADIVFYDEHEVAILEKEPLLIPQ